MEIRTDQPIMQDHEQIIVKIGEFWDQISAGWRQIWGPHIHHGYYADNPSLPPLQAQELLIDKLADMAQIKAQDKILDVGCGMGGSSIYLAKNYHAQVQGITLSPRQVELAIEHAKAAKITGINFKVENALELSSFAENSIDIVWSLESCEQFYDKQQFIRQAHRILKPGGKLMLATWCADKAVYANKEAKEYAKLCKAFDVPFMPTIEYYANILTNNEFSLQQKLDWSEKVQQSWDIGISLVNAYSLWQIFRLGGWRGFRFAAQIRLMRNAFHNQMVRYGVFLATKK